MAVFIVTWNLNNEKLNYSKARSEFISLFDHIEHIRDPDLDSVTFISVNISANQVRDYLFQALDDNDRLFVSKLERGECQGWLDLDVANWINARI